LKKQRIKSKKEKDMRIALSENRLLNLEEKPATIIAVIEMTIGINRLKLGQSNIFKDREVNELSKIINNEVPAALFCEILKKRMKVGIARKPPPTPKIPVSNPRETASKNTNQNVGTNDVGLGNFIERRIAESNKIAEYPTATILSGKEAEIIVPPTFANKPILQIIRASFIRTSRARNLGIKALSEAKKATISAALEA
jgi:hypothetical protein